MIILSLLVFSITALSILILRPISILFDLVDKPSDRKSHIGDIPLVGGLAIFIAVNLGFLLLNSSFNSELYYSLLFSSSILIILGVLDDLHDISFAIRLLLQITAASIIAFLGGVELFSLGEILSNKELYLGKFSLFVTIVAIVAVINSMNFSDGIDGLAASMSLVTLSSIGFFAYLSGNAHELSFVALVIVSIFGFLIFNIGPVSKKGLKIFLGDSGSMFLGFIIAFLLIYLTQGEFKIFSPVTALWIYSIPLMDSFSILIRRISKGQSPFLPDRKHLHHLFLALGRSDRETLIIIILLSIMMAITGILMEVNGVEESYMFVFFIIVSLLYSFLTIFKWKSLED